MWTGPAIAKLPDEKYADPPRDVYCAMYLKVQVGKNQEKAQSEKDSHSKNRGGKKKKKQTN